MDLSMQSNLPIRSELQKQKSVSGFINQNDLIKGSILFNSLQLDSHSIITKPNKYEFPSIGAQDVLYVATDENKVYRWDDTELKYFVVGTNYEDIKIINGGSANEY